MAAPSLSVAGFAQAEGGRTFTNFGVQLSTLTRLMMADFEGTLAKVAEIGYTQIEFSAMGFLGRSVDEIRVLLDRYSLAAPVGRVTPALPENFMTLPPGEAMQIYRERGKSEHLKDNVAHSLEGAVALGQKYLNLPALMPDEFQTLDQVKNNIDRLNEVGEMCAKEGVLFGYHNHNWELAEIEGQIPYDLMLEGTGDGTVGFQLDTYWIVKGGGSLDDYLSRFPGRFPSCHLKDIDDEGDFEDVGSGQIDFAAFIPAAQSAGAKYFFVERDNPPDPEGSVRRSFDYLSQLKI